MRLKRLIIFLMRKRFGLKKYEFFRFSNQKDKSDLYCFTSIALLKVNDSKNVFRNAHVSLSWLLDDRCKIEKV